MKGSMKWLSLVMAIVLLGSMFSFAAAEEKTSLSFMHFHSVSDTAGTAKAFDQASTEFLAANPNVEITSTYVAHDDYETNLKVLVTGDELPDLFLCKGDMLANLAKAGKIVPVADLMDDAWKAEYLDTAFGDALVDGVPYGFPFQMQPNAVVYYNKDILTACGVDTFPATYAELLTAIEKIKAGGYTPIALGNKDQWVAESCLLNTFAYRYVDGTWFESLKNKTGAKFTDAAFVQALTDFQALATAGAFNADMNSINNNEQEAMYMNKKAAMFIEGAWALGNIIKDAPEDVKAATEFAAIPAVEGQAGGVQTGVAGGAGWSYVIKAGLTDAQQKAALDYYKAITTGTYGTYALEAGFVPACKTANVDATKLDPLFAKYSALASTWTFLPIFDVQLSSPVASELYARTQELLIGATTPQEFAEACQAVLDAE